jgi:hypothetical protein
MNGGGCCDQCIHGMHWLAGHFAARYQPSPLIRHSWVDIQNTLFEAVYELASQPAIKPPFALPRRQSFNPMSQFG